MLMKEIIDEKKDSGAIPEEDAYYSTKSGPKPKRTTRGWRLLVDWKDGTGSWVSLADLKDSYPVQVVDYALANGSTQEPAFRWWVPFVLKKRERILKQVKTKYWSVTHKYGLELPKSVAQALAIDRKTGTDFWKMAIEKEIRNVFPAFEFLENNETQGTAWVSIRRDLLRLRHQDGHDKKSEVGRKRKHDGGDQGGHLCIRCQQRYSQIIISPGGA